MAGSIFGKSKYVEGEVRNKRRNMAAPGLSFVGRSLIAPEYIKVMVYLRRRKWGVLDRGSGTQGN